MPDNFFAGGMEEFLPVGNGILRVNDRKLLRFSPKFHYRNKLAVDFISGAKCPTFETVLLGGALDADDIGLLQRWSGLCIDKQEHFTGYPDFKRHSRCRQGHVCSRAGTRDRRSECRQFANRPVESAVSRLVGWLVTRLLYGADVPANFLSSENASILKSLTGGDPINGGNERQHDRSCQLKGEFNVIVVEQFAPDGSPGRRCFRLATPFENHRLRKAQTRNRHSRSRQTDFAKRGVRGFELDARRP